jgi:EmrB/QacA subfamily drug resistance transporter
MEERLSVVAQIGLLAGPFLTMVDSNIVNVALPDIASDLSSPLTSVQWVVSAYLLSLGIVLAASAYLAKRFGTRRVYLASLVGFTVASALCAASPTVEALVGARVLQGALGAPLVPLAMGMLLGGGSAEGQLPPAAGILLFLAPAIGPSLGGFLVELAGWPYIFLINLPLGVAATYGVLRIPARLGGRPDPSVRFDLIGFCMLAAGLALAIYGASQGPQDGWTAVGSWPYWSAGFLLLAAYVGWALRRSNPAVDVGLLRDAQTALALSLSVLASVVLFVMLFLMPVFIQDLQGYTVLVAGLALLPQGILTGVGTVLGNKLSPKWGVRLTSVVGMVILTASTALLLAVEVSTPVWVTAAILSGRGLALGLVIQPLLHAIIGGLPREKVADGNTFFNVAQRLGGSVGIPLVATLLQVRIHARVSGVLGGTAKDTGSNFSTLSSSALPAPIRARLAQAATAGFHDVVWLLVAVCVFGLLVASLIQSRSPSKPKE